MRGAGAARQRAAPLKKAGVEVSQAAIQAYLADLSGRGRREETVRFYAAKLKAFYDYLPPDKQVSRDTLEAWRQALLAEGYAPATVNTHVSAVNGLLEFLDRRDLQLIGQLQAAPEPQPELTRTEYLRLLSAARAQGNERAYLLVKVFAVTGIPVHGLPELTVEAVRANALAPEPGGPRRPIPASLREELLAYIRRRELTGGPVFVTRSGRPLSRTAVTAAIQSLAGDAQVAPEKCNPRCLRKLCQTTLAEIEADVRRLVEQTRDQLLEQEQRLVGWEARDPP